MAKNPNVLFISVLTGGGASTAGHTAVDTNPNTRACIAVSSVLANRSKNNLQSAHLLIGRELVSGSMDGCRASAQHSCSRRDRPKLGRLQYPGSAVVRIVSLRANSFFL